MTPLYYLNYFIYRFYESRDPDPIIYAVNGSALLILLNFLTVFYGFNFFLLDQNFHLGYFLILTLLFLIASNYLLVYKGGKHKGIFNIIRTHDSSLKQIICLTYILFSLISCLFVILTIKYLKFGSI